jgi:hypothetical protein
MEAAERGEVIKCDSIEDMLRKLGRRIMALSPLLTNLYKKYFKRFKTAREKYG